MKALIVSIAGKIGRRLRRLARVPAPAIKVRTPAERPGKSAPAAPPSRPCFVAIAADCGHCNDGCRATQKEWQAWLEETFRGYRSARLAETDLPAVDLASLEEHKKVFHGSLSATLVPLAMVDLTAGHEAYWQRIGAKGRNMVRKAEKLGYSFAQFSWNERLDDIFAVNTSMSHRGGKEMTASYRERPAAIGSSGFCDLQLRGFYGGFKDGTLYAYLVLAVFGHFAVINTILGHGEHLKSGIMNGLIDFLIRDLGREGKVRYVNYLTMKGGREGLDSFKKHVGFEERTAIFLSGPSRAA